MKTALWLTAALAFFSVSTVYSAPMWESGELTYPNGETEISAFVNTPGNTQLQAVLCSKNAVSDYRFTLLLPNRLDTDSVIKVQIKTDDLLTEEYAEVSGNSIDLQIDPMLLLALPETPSMTLIFDEEEAAYLGIPTSIEVSMSGADMTLRKVSSECTALCIGNNFKCNYPVLSSLLWPQDKYESSKNDDIDELCTKQTGPSEYSFNFTQSCALALDRFYKKDGIGPLSFLESQFNSLNSSFQKYIKDWNEAVALSPSGALPLDVQADMSDWYLVLYSLVGSRHIKEYPNSFFEIKNFNGDPTTLVYDTDNRYEMEGLKYSAVLYRRLKGSVQATNAVERALKSWSSFYRAVSAALPNIPQALALKPLIYRRMLMRTWKLAGRPSGIRLLPENIFIQGSGGKTTSNELLESECSFFDGANGEQFYFASDDCIKGIEAYLQVSTFNTEKLQKVLKKWDKFAENWQKSPFYNDSIDDAVGEHPRANLGLALITLFKIYGFGDYFLLRECISSQDEDICQYETQKAYKTYKKEIAYRLDSIFSVNAEDGNNLASLNKMWLSYYHALEKYVDDLSETGKLPKWRAEFIKGIACIEQTNAVLNFPYDREQLPDLSEDPDGANLHDYGRMLIEIENEQKEESPDAPDPDSMIDEDIIIPE